MFAGSYLFSVVDFKKFRVALIVDEFFKQLESTGEGSK